MNMLHKKFVVSKGPVLITNKIDLITKKIQNKKKVDEIHLEKELVFKIMILCEPVIYGKKSKLSV